MTFYLTWLPQDDFVLNMDILSMISGESRKGFAKHDHYNSHMNSSVLTFYLTMTNKEFNEGSKIQSRVRLFCHSVSIPAVLKLNCPLNFLVTYYRFSRSGYGWKYFQLLQDSS